MRETETPFEREPSMTPPPYPVVSDPCVPMKIGTAHLSWIYVESAPTESLNSPPGFLVMPASRSGGKVGGGRRHWIGAQPVIVTERRGKGGGGRVMTIKKE